MITKHGLLRLLACAAAALALLPGARADDYPSRPIKLIVGFPPGQGSDSIARAVAQRMQAVMGQTWIVDNRAGASGSLAQQAAAAAPPDGYTVLLTSAGPMAVNQGVYDKCPTIRSRTTRRSAASPPSDGAGGAPVVPGQDSRRAGRPGQGKTERDQLRLQRCGLTAHMSMELLSLAAGIQFLSITLAALHEQEKIMRRPARAAPSTLCAVRPAPLEA